MKGAKSAQERFIVAPKGRYKSKIVGAEATFSKKGGRSMLKLDTEIRDPAQWAGQGATDYIVTDLDGFKGAAISKKKLRGLGIDVDSTDEEIPDSEIATRLLGLDVWVEYDQEQMTEESVKGSNNYDRPSFEFDPKTGKNEPRMKLIVKGYSLVNVGGVAQVPQVAPQQFAAQPPPVTQPPQYAVPVQPVAPAGYAPAPQLAAPPAPQPVPPQQWQQPAAPAPVPVAAPPQQYAQPQPQYAAPAPTPAPVPVAAPTPAPVPVAAAPQPQPTATPPWLQQPGQATAPVAHANGQQPDAGAVPPWMTQQPAPVAVAAPAPDAGESKKRKKKGEGEAASQG